MLSPLGVSSKPEGWNTDKEFEKFPKKNRPPKLVIKMAKFSWKNKISPFSIMRKTGKLLSKKMLKNFAERRLAALPKEDSELFAKYLY